MEIKLNSIIIGEMFGHVIQLIVKKINHRENLISLDVVSGTTNQIFVKNIELDLRKFKNDLDFGKAVFILNIRLCDKKQPICIKDISFKNGQIEDEGACEDEI